MGGLVAQEMIKALTQKFVPVRQLFYADCVEVLPALCEQKALFEQKAEQSPLKVCLGGLLLDRLRSAQVFMVGVGALGCELLKNLAMLGVAESQEQS